MSLASSGHRFSDVDLDDPNCHVGVIVPDDRKISPISEGVRGYARYRACQSVWTKSEQMVGESF